MKFMTTFSLANFRILIHIISICGTYNGKTNGVINDEQDIVISGVNALLIGALTISPLAQCVALTVPRDPLKHGSSRLPPINATRS